MIPCAEIPALLYGKLVIKSVYTSNDSDIISTIAGGLIWHGEETGSSVS